MSATPQHTHPFRNENSPDDSRNRDTTRRANEVNVRLPPVDIEHFDGDPLKYPSFMSTFEEMIHRNPKLAEVQKFYYLRGLLRGKAKSTIEGFVFTDGNYREALDLLKQRFGDTKMLQASFISSLMNLKCFFIF